MSKFLQVLAMEATAIACVVMAGLIALEGKDGWGWFLLIACLTTVSYSSKTPKPQEQP
jgi:hypothetical protein